MACAFPITHQASRGRCRLCECKLFDAIVSSDCQCSHCSTDHVSTCFRIYLLIVDCVTIITQITPTCLSAWRFYYIIIFVSCSESTFNQNINLLHFSCLFPSWLINFRLFWTDATTDNVIVVHSFPLRNFWSATLVDTRYLIMKQV